ncbi:DUF3152 domain-containing protein [Corynebacterium felinum]|uniref:DUF3152 domain-containing protein n=1 Tax=Corynebacterium felinum TaxID=131318 RepID=A0ABU2BAD6_9CORY|nr:DUF3152 domain-containing protein [Corynebacterium felinum]MDF5821079.1 DUF3152 domain-containing protein [Corynebacterium felinum]MDR7354944.1 hypothetical protein [Corynebacterium felinum]WJY94302.1 hypothetical protein CFELI_03300 [Corynebacterium felinum]
MRFARQYGWRAYAIPVLAVITLWVLYDVVTHPIENSQSLIAQASQQQSNPDNTATSNAEQGGENSRGAGPSPAGKQLPALQATQLPNGGSFTVKGTGHYRTVGKPGAAAGQGTEKTFRYVIEIEEGINTASYGGDDAFAAMVDATLTSVKGWTHDPRFRFEHIQASDGVEPDLRIQLTSVETTHATCGTDIAMETSCFYAVGNRVVINESRWVRGATPFQGDLGGYRHYLINHEVGHGIGFAQHAPCGGNGQLAPVMMQQTMSLSNTELFAINPQETYKDDGFVCIANPWPYPHA